MFAVFAFVSIGLFYLAIPRYTPYVFVTLLIYLFHVYYLNFSYIRQGLVVACFFYSLRYLKEKSFWKYTACIIIGALFHVSALILIPFYFILNRNIPGFYYILGIAVALVLYKIGWLDKVMDVATGGNPLVSKFMGTAAHFSSRGAAGLSSRFFEYLLLLLICLFNKKRLSQELPYFFIFINLSFAYLIVYILFNDLQIMVERIGVLFLIGPILLYSYVLVLLRQNFLKVAVYVFMGMVVLFRGYNFFYAPVDAPLSNAEQFFPYRNYLIESLN